MELLKSVVNPNEDQLEALFSRYVDKEVNLKDQVRTIINQVKTDGDKALISLTKQIDNVELDNLLVSKEKLKEYSLLIDDKLKTSIDRAFNNIKKFHEAQIPKDEFVEIEKGINLWRKSIPIENVGIYIPGGSAPLFSTLLMTATLAKIAKCKRVVVTTPPTKEGKVDPAISYVALKLDVDEFYLVGGAQAIAALAYGTESIKKVDKIFGPGNRWVTEAKVQVSEVCAIDMPAGPSEVMVVIDQTSEAQFVSSDLLSQLEHGIDSQAILVVYDKDVGKGLKIKSQVEDFLIDQMASLKREDVVRESLKNSMAVIVDSKELLVKVINSYAAEHLLLQTVDCDKLAEKVVNGASVFIGPYSCESAGDYASGTNHTLPTNRWARSLSGLSLDSFLKKVTFQKLSKEGLKSIGPTIINMAENEKLDAHALAVKVRLKK
ncbi:MAG: histidinol dehydrogenase [Sphaerochaetaceae bacterium]